MTELLSNIERAHKADEERRALKGAIPMLVTPRPAPTPEQQKQAARSAAARALPDALFDDDAEVQRLRATYEARLAVSNGPVIARQWMPSAMQRLAEHVDAAQKSIAWDVLSDAVAKDDNFPQARAALAALEADKALLAAVRAAYALVNGGPCNTIQLDDAIAQARKALQDRLFALKLAHVDTQAAETKEA